MPIYHKPTDFTRYKEEFELRDQNHESVFEIMYHHAINPNTIVMRFPDGNEKTFSQKHFDPKNQMNNVSVFLNYLNESKF